MSNPEERVRKRNRRIRHIAKDLMPKYRSRIVKTKRGKIDLEGLSHADLIKLIQE